MYVCQFVIICEIAFSILNRRIWAKLHCKNLINFKKTTINHNYRTEIQLYIKKRQEKRDSTNKSIFSISFNNFIEWSN